MKTVVDLLLYFFQGTVEFIMDKEQNFYFMEMNTRLQVRNAYQLFSLCQLTNSVLVFFGNIFDQTDECNQNSIMSQCFPGCSE